MCTLERKCKVDMRNVCSEHWDGLLLKLAWRCAGADYVVHADVPRIC